MTTAQYLTALKKLGLSPYGKVTAQALGVSVRQLCRYATGGTITKTTELLINSLLKQEKQK